MQTLYYSIFFDCNYQKKIINDTILYEYIHKSINLNIHYSDYEKPQLDYEIMYFKSGTCSGVINIIIRSTLPIISQIIDYFNHTEIMDDDFRKVCVLYNTI